MLIPPADVVAISKATIKECSVTDLEHCLKVGTLLIDVREPGEFQRSHIPGAVLLPRGLLEFQIHALVERMTTDTDTVREDQPIVLYCGTGGRSALAASTLQSMGYRNVMSMAGGIVAWAAVQLPLEGPDSTPLPY